MRDPFTFPNHRIPWAKVLKGALLKVETKLHLLRLFLCISGLYFPACYSVIPRSKRKRLGELNGAETAPTKELPWLSSLTLLKGITAKEVLRDTSRGYSRRKPFIKPQYSGLSLSKLRATFWFFCKSGKLHRLLKALEGLGKRHSLILWPP